MKKYLSGFITGIALTILVGSLVIGASAISSKMTIEIDPINVQVNGAVFQPKDANGNNVPVFSYNGTTYAPLRALAEAYGLEVGYDAGSNMATVKEPKTTSVNTLTSDTTTKSEYSFDYSYEEFLGLWCDVQRKGYSYFESKDDARTEAWLSSIDQDTRDRYFIRLGEEEFANAKSSSDDPRDIPPASLFKYANKNKIVSVWPLEDNKLDYD